VLGWSNVDIAEQLKVHRNTVSRLRNDDECQGYVDEMQKELMQQTVQTMFQYMEKQPALAARMIGIAMDSEHPKAFEANKYIQDRILPERRVNSGTMDVNVSIHAETLLPIQTTLNKITQIHDGAQPVDVTNSPHLREGRDAVPTVTLAAEDGGPPPAWDPDARKRPNGPVTDKAPLRLQQHEGARDTVKGKRVHESATGE
jgi:hypothetical protein